jgi:glucose/sorbosone dehydrogenase
MVRDERGSLQFLRCSLAFALVLATVACGGDSNSNDDSNNNSNLPQVRGGMRLGWSQPAASLQQLRSMSYQLYVSGSAAMLTAVTCGDTASATGYGCTGVLPSMSPGIHDLELSAVFQGVESSRSPGLRVNAVTSSTTAVASPAVDAQARSLVNGIACTTSRRLCFTPTAVVARDFQDATSLTPTPDGRLLFVEGATKVRVVANQTLVREPALVAPTSSRIVGMAVDADFTASHLVYVASTDQTTGKGVTLNITRYREVTNTLGEAATIVTALPFAADAMAPLAVDASGLLYAAMPSTTDADDSGALLRFTRDGRVPSENANASPIIAFGYSRPTGLAIDSAKRRIWVSGNTARWTHGVSTFSLTSDAGTAWPRLPRTLGTWVQSERFHAANIGLTRREGETSRLLITAGRQLYDGLIGEDGRLNALNEVIFNGDLAIEVAAPGPSGRLFVVVKDAGGAASILQMQLQQ